MTEAKKTVAKKAPAKAANTYVYYKTAKQEPAALMVSVIGKSWTPCKRGGDGICHFRVLAEDKDKFEKHFYITTGVIVPEAK